MTVYVAGKGAVQEVPMQLNIQPIKGSHNYTWNIVYGADGKDSRPYELLTIDSAKGHYIVDEKDSIRLDAYLIGGKLFSQFEVEGTMLLTTDYREGDALISEIVAGPAKEIAITGGHTKETPPVRSYAVRTRQVAVMHRQKVAPTNTPTPKK